jgi:hypothetical protein
MAYTFATIQTAVRVNVNNVTADVTQPIDDAINFLSNFFDRKIIDTTILTVASQVYITMPTYLQKIDRLTINGDEYERLSIDKIGEAESDGNKYFYEYNEQIQILPTPSSALATKIWGRCGFTPLAGVGSSDVPNRLVPLVVVLASWIYWLGMVGKVGSARENYPDMTPEEAGKIATEYKKQFDSMVSTIKQYAV